MGGGLEISTEKIASLSSPGDLQHRDPTQSQSAGLNGAPLAVCGHPLNPMYLLCRSLCVQPVHPASINREEVSCSTEDCSPEEENKPQSLLAGG